MTFSDSHCHLDFEAFAADLPAVIERAAAADVSLLLIPSLDAHSAAAGLEIASQHPGIMWVGVGIHPNTPAGDVPEAIRQLRTLARRPEARAIGEIGLDYYRDYTSPSDQRKLFQAQLDLAAEMDLPVLIHCREAQADVEAMLTDWHNALPAASPLKANPGVLHAFSGDAGNAERLGALGFCFGIAGPITYPSAGERRALLRQLPLKQILLETDAPFLSPQAHRGQRNEPAYIPIIARTVSEVLEISMEELASLTTGNLRRMLRLKETD